MFNLPERKNAEDDEPPHDGVDKDDGPEDGEEHLHWVSLHPQQQEQAQEQEGRLREEEDGAEIAGHAHRVWTLSEEEHLQLDIE